MKPFIIHPSPASHQDVKARERRRRKAAAFFARGLRQAEVARRLGVTKPAVHYWYTTWKQRGKEGLSARRPGPRSQLTPEKARRVRELLLRGASAAGYDTDLWTLQRIAATLQSSLRLTYGITQTWYLLHALGWSNQKPETRYRDRNEAAIKRWKEVRWPAIQKKGSVQARDSGFPTNPPSRTSRW